MDEGALQLTATVVEAAQAGPAHDAAADLIAVSGPLTILTWVTFGLMAALLYRVAWKPILAALEQRERAIRKSLADAETARAETASAEVRNRQNREASETEARRLVAEARAAAEAATEGIQARARHEAQAMVEAARREIETATAQARQALRAETADLAVNLAAKVIGDSLDPARQRDLVDRLLKDA